MDAELEQKILELLSTRSRSATICPSDAARSVGATDVDAEGWRDVMDAARCAARRLVASGDVHIVQGGRVVDPATAKGPIRIRRA